MREMRCSVIGMVLVFCFDWRVSEGSAMEEDGCALADGLLVLGLEVDALGTFSVVDFRIDVWDFLGLPRRRG